MALAEQRWLRLFTLCILYGAQGIPFGFLAATLPAYITEASGGTASIASALVMTTLPYTFKWIWGPVIDLVGIPALGRRRPWVMFAQLMMALTILAMLAVPDVTRDLDVVVWIVFVHAVFNSMQDVAVDALAIDLLGEDERGRANGLMYACKYGGSLIGVVVMGRVVAELGITSALLVIGAILLGIFVVPLVLRERTGGELPVQRPATRDVLAGIAQVATQRTTLVLAVFMLGSTLCSGVLSAASFGLYIHELQWTAVFYTDFAGGLGYVSGFAGALLGGFLADLIGRRRLVVIASIALASGWLAFALATPLWDNQIIVAMFAMWAALLQSMMIVGSFALCMDATWSRIAATQFAAFMALQAMSTTLGYKLSAWAVTELGYRDLYIAAAMVQLAITTILFAVRKPDTRALPLSAGWTFNVTGVLTTVLVTVAIGIVPILLLVL